MNGERGCLILSGSYMYSARRLHAAGLPAAENVEPCMNACVQGQGYDPPNAHLDPRQIAGKEHQQQAPQGYPFGSPGSLLAAVMAHKLMPPPADPPLGTPTPHAQASPAHTAERTRMLKDYPRLQIPDLPLLPSEGFARDALGARARSEVVRQGTMRSSLVQTRRSRRDLSPIKQRAMSFRAGINKTSGAQRNRAPT